MATVKGAKCKIEIWYGWFTWSNQTSEQWHARGLLSTLWI